MDSYTEDKKLQVTVAFNRFGPGLTQRMPRVRFGFAHVVNNNYLQWEMYAIGGSSAPTIISEGNRFEAPNNPHAKRVNIFIITSTLLHKQTSACTHRYIRTEVMITNFSCNVGDKKRSRPRCVEVVDLEITWRFVVERSHF